MFSKEPSSLEDISVNSLLENMTLRSCFKTLQLSDQLQIERLKINTLKFISLNLLSLLENIDEFFELPQYLMQDVENFIKSGEVNKYALQDCELLE